MLRIRPLGHAQGIDVKAQGCDRALSAPEHADDPGDAFLHIVCQIAAGRAFLGEHGLCMLFKHGSIRNAQAHLRVQNFASGEHFIAQGVQALGDDGRSAHFKKAGFRVHMEGTAGADHPGLERAGKGTNLRDGREHVDTSAMIVDILLMIAGCAGSW